VYNLLRSADKKELYPGDRPDTIDFTLGPQTEKLGAGWYEVEGVYGNKYRWMQAQAEAVLKNVRGGAQALRIRGLAHEKAFAAGTPRLKIHVNDAPWMDHRIDRVGLFVIEGRVPDAPEYRIRIEASPLWQCPPDQRHFTVNLSTLRLVPV
jgi:hypothetical protein